MDPFLGEILLFAGNFAPRGWALCEGQILPINQNQSLYSLLGTTYGGDGQTTFALPDLRGRAPVSQGTGYPLGQKGGNATTTLTTANLPQAPINLGVSNQAATETEPTGNVLAVSANGKSIYGDTATGNIKNGTIMGAANTSFSNQPPYLALNYIIALQGTFPSRS